MSRITLPSSDPLGASLELYDTKGRAVVAELNLRASRGASAAELKALAADLMREVDALWATIKPTRESRLSHPDRTSEDATPHPTQIH